LDRPGAGYTSLDTKELVMGSFASMAIVVGVLAVVLIAVFVFLWSRDKNRSDSVADDPARMDTDTTPHNRPANGR
jgi:hypothetical protein